MGLLARPWVIRGTLGAPFRWSGRGENFAGHLIIYQSKRERDQAKRSGGGLAKLDEQIAPGAASRQARGGNDFTQLDGLLVSCYERLIRICTNARLRRNTR